LGIFTPVYRLLFRRQPKLVRRSSDSDNDGPTFEFSIDEVIPALKARFGSVRCLSFYKVGRLQLRGVWLPRLFARQGVVVAQKKLVRGVLGSLQKTESKGAL